MINKRVKEDFGIQIQPFSQTKLVQLHLCSFTNISTSDTIYSLTLKYNNTVASKVPSTLHVLFHLILRLTL